MIDMNSDHEPNTYKMIARTQGVTVHKFKEQMHSDAQNKYDWID